jgi:hypothetical protein
MVSKITAQFVIVMFIVFTIVGLIMKYILKFNFSLDTYYWYVLLFSALVLVLARPFVKIALDLINQPFKQQEEHFKIPYSDIKPKSDKEEK